YLTVPRMSTLSFLMCRASSSKEVLSAVMNIYFGGRFIGSTYLEEKKPGQDFDLNLGTDREVAVKREKIKDKLDEKMFGKIERLTLIRELGYKITVENMKDKEIKVQLIDSVPVSKTDKIEVKDLAVTPEPAKKNYLDKEGVYLWEFVIKPKEKKEIEINFTVLYPKDAPVIGL
ncbi:MAG: DUF4139 domain-containing protein, partial [Candidatus Omnitrophica bacterium]|nr:DUF4139 domain-containing protein [Candidatus Omnitrophota bacterium]